MDIENVKPVESQQEVVETQPDEKITSVQQLQEKANANQVGSESEETDLPKYSPDFKIKVRHEDKEIDEFFRPFIKDKDSEAKFKDIFTKAYGLPHVKNHLDQTLNELTSTKKEKDQLVSIISGLKDSVDKGQLEDFLEAWGLDDEKVFQYALKRIKLSENPELKQHYEQSLMQRRNAEAAEAEREYLRDQNQSIVSKQHQMEFNYTSKAPEIVAFSGRFDSLPGHKQGDFEEEVLRYGNYVFAKTGQDIPIQQAFVETINRYKPLVDGYATQAQAQQQQIKVVTQSQAPKTIPNVGSSSSSNPTKHKVTSLEDLQKLADSYTR